MVDGHRIEVCVGNEEFVSIIQGLDPRRIIVTDHALFRLNENQRKIFKESVVKNYLLSESPFLVGIQKNKCYTAFYGYGKEVLRIILDIKPDKANIVTFYIIDRTQVPKI